MAFIDAQNMSYPTSFCISVFIAIYLSCRYDKLLTTSLDIYILHKVYVNLTHVKSIGVYKENDILRSLQSGI